MTKPEDNPSNNSKSVTTTGATAATLATIPIPLNSTLLVEVKVIARRTGGASGSVQDAAGYILAASFKNMGGQAVKIGEGSLYSSGDQSDWSVTFAVHEMYALLQVIGSVNNNIIWTCKYETFTASF